MSIHPVDGIIILAYLVVVVAIGFVIRKRATKGIASFFLADRNVPWWILGLSGCSSYIDIGGTMAIVGLVACLGLKSVWVSHISWGFFIMAFFMAFQAKWIRRSGVMTFAEWNKTRYGNDRDAELARIASGIFVLALMTCNLTYLAVGVGKFAGEFLPFPMWCSTLIIFCMVGLYVTMGGFLGVILTDVIQTLLIAIGALFLGYLAYKSGGAVDLSNLKDIEWSSLAPTWTLWSSYTETTPDAYGHYYYLGPFLMAGFLWLIFRVLAGPNVWDFQFFLTARSPRDASLSAGLWTVGFTMRWVMVLAFLILGVGYLSGVQGQAFDAERIMPLVLMKLPVGVTGLFLAVLMAALMSSLDAAINVTSSVIVNDFLKRYFARSFSEKQLVHAGQLCCVIVLGTSYLLSFFFDQIVTVWEIIIFVVVTMILVPATFRWHWWRFSAKAFVWGMAASAGVVVCQKALFSDLSASASLAGNVTGCFIVTLACGFLAKPTSMDTLVQFYARVRPFGFWGPVRREAAKRSLVPERDLTGVLDAFNGVAACVFQACLCLVPFYFFLGKTLQLWVSTASLVVSSVTLYFTWYKTLPERE